MEDPGSIPGSSTNCCFARARPLPRPTRGLTGRGFTALTGVRFPAAPPISAITPHSGPTQCVDADRDPEQQINSVLREIRARYLNGEGDGTFTDADIARFTSIGTHYFDVVVHPLLVDAANADKCQGLEEKRAAIFKAIHWAQWMNYIFGDDADAAMGGRIDKMYRLIGKIATAPCTRKATGEITVRWTEALDGGSSTIGHDEFTAQASLVSAWTSPIRIPIRILAAQVARRASPIAELPTSRRPATARVKNHTLSAGVVHSKTVP